jgi:Domain of unknown function (DUF5753)
MGERDRIPDRDGGDLPAGSYPDARPGAGQGADTDELVPGRMERQAVLTREEPPPPLLWVLVDESVLHQPVAPPSVMHDQLFI